MNRFLSISIILSSVLFSQVYANVTNASWHCFDKNVGVEVTVFDVKDGIIKFSFLNEDIAKFSFEEGCSFLKDDGRIITFRCHNNPKYGDFGFGIVRNWNHSIHSGFFYNNHGEFQNTRPIGAQAYNEFLVCSENVDVNN